MSEQYAKGAKMQALVEELIRSLVEKQPTTDAETFAALQEWLDARAPLPQGTGPEDEALPSPRGAWRRHIDTKLMEAPSVQGTHELHTPTRQPPRVGQGSFGHGVDFGELGTEGELRLDNTMSNPKVFDMDPLEKTAGEIFEGLSCMDRERSRSHASESQSTLPAGAYVTSYLPPYPLRLPDTSLSRADPLLVQDYIKKGDGVLGPRYKASRGTDGLPLSVKCITVPNAAEVHPYFLHEMYGVINSSRHDNIVHTYDCWMDDESYTMRYTQEYIETPDALSHFTTQARPEGEYLSILYQMLLALQHLHYNGLAHANITATNVFVAEHEDGVEGLCVKLGDFLVTRKYFLPVYWSDYQTRMQDSNADPYSFDVMMVAEVMQALLNARADRPRTPTLEAIQTAVKKAIDHPSSMMELLTLATKALFKGSTSTIESVVPVVTFGSDGFITKFSFSAETLFGYEAADVIGKKKLFDLTRATVSSSEHSQFITCLNKDKQEIAVEMKLIGGTTAIFRDVSFNASLTQLHTLREERAVVADYIGVPIVSINQKSIITEYNLRAAELFGYTPGHAMGQNVSILMTPDIAKHHHEYIAAGGRSKFGQSLVVNNTRDVLCKHRDGSVFCTKLHIRTLNSSVPCSPNGGVLSSPRGGGAWSAYFVGAVLTTSASNYNVLPKSAAHIVNILRQVSPSMGYCVINELGTVLEFTDKCYDLTGWKRSDVLGNNISTIMVDGIARHHQTYLDRYIRKPSGTASNVVGNKRVVEVKLKTGGTAPLDITVVDMEPVKGIRAGGQRLFLGVFAEASEGQHATDEGVTPPASPKSQRFDRLHSVL